MRARGVIVALGAVMTTALIVGLLVGCEVKVTNPTGAIDCYPTVLNFETDGGSAEVAVVTKHGNWAASTEESWITVTPKGGATDMTVTVTVKSGKEATGKVKFRNSQGYCYLNIGRGIKLDEEGGEGEKPGPTDDEPDKIVGCLPGVFTIGDYTNTVGRRQVYFSKGNLRYKEGIWYFAEHQWEVLGAANGQSEYDLFGYGTSGWKSGAKYYQPFDDSEDACDYLNQNLVNDYANGDWGVYNAISNGGGKKGLWRVLTQGEWSFLLTGGARNPNGEPGELAGAGQVGDVNGLILLPDDWKTPTGIAFYSFAQARRDDVMISADSNGKSYWDFWGAKNKFSKSQWEKMEKMGAVFLPCGGRRTAFGYDPDEMKYIGGYWSSSTAKDYEGGWYCQSYIQAINHSGRGHESRAYGYSVRLVREIKPKY